LSDPDDGNAQAAEKTSAGRTSIRGAAVDIPRLRNSIAWSTRMTLARDNHTTAASTSHLTLFFQINESGENR